MQVELTVLYQGIFNVLHQKTNVGFFFPASGSDLCGLDVCLAHFPPAADNGHFKENNDDFLE